MHYIISTKVLGQTHMWYTQHKWSNFLKIFQFLWVFEFFNTLKNRTCKVRSTKKIHSKTWKKKHHLTWTCETLKASMHQWTKWGHTRDKVQGMIPTPMVLRKNLNLGPLRGLVNMSAFWLSMLMNFKHTIFSSTKSQMKWYRISICFDFKCWTGFFDRFMALVLSQNTHIVSWVIP